MAPDDVELVNVPVFKRPTMPPTFEPPLTTTLEVATLMALTVLPDALIKPTTPPALLAPPLEPLLDTVSPGSGV